MDLSSLANAVNAVAVTAGVVFAAAQIRDYRRQRRRDAMLELGPEGEDDIFLLGLTWESLGILLFRRELTIDVMDDFFSGAIVISWRKLRVFVEEDRRFMARETVWEWFQWLAERMIEREHTTPPAPAHLAHRAWR